MKIYLFFLYIYYLKNFVQAQLDLVDTSVQNQRPWCWTNDSPNQIQPNHGGINWGYVENIQSQLLTYRVYVSTANMGDAGSEGHFFIQMFGTKSQTSQIILSDHGFKQGKTDIINILAPNVGDLRKIKITNSGTDAYRCVNIRIELAVKFWTFECTEYIACPLLCTSEMELQGDIKYTLFVRTINEVDASTVAPVYVQLIGVEGKTKSKMISEKGFEAGRDVEIDVMLQDVGQIYGVTFSETEDETWRPESVIVLREGQNETLFDLSTLTMECPYKCSITKTVPKPGEDYVSTDDSAASKMNDESDISQKLLFDYEGAALNLEEKSKLHLITCNDVVYHNDLFGPDYSDNRANYKLMYVQCPNGCDVKGDARVFGWGLHPEESGICKSAIVDRAVPVTGGIVGVGITFGVEYYQKEDDFKFGIQIQEFQKSKKSFYTFQVDNVNMMEKSWRLLDFQGKANFEGRLETRVNGEWGSVCKKGLDDRVVGKICATFGYNDGILKNVQGGLEFPKLCKDYKGEDYCGSPNSPVHFKNMNCEKDVTNLEDCTKDVAVGDADCTHDEDAIIECLNVDYNIKQEPPKGAVRLIDYEGAPSTNGEGRLEYYNKRWGSVCNLSFDYKAARIACQMMGFQSGQIEGKFEEAGFCAFYHDKNYCADKSYPITAANIKCNGKEKHLINCQVQHHENERDCNHEQDQIIKCLGKGDSTGYNQIQAVKTKVLKPLLGKLPLVPEIILTCDQKGNEPFFPGDQGSIYIVFCPENCDSSQGTIWGTGIYSEDSAVCKAAIHSGIIQRDGGKVEFIKGPVIQKFEGNENRGIVSQVSEQHQKSFFLARTNTISLKLCESFKDRIPPVQKNKQQSFLQINYDRTSFIQKDLEVVDIDTTEDPVFKNGYRPQYIFKWIQKGGHLFDGLHGEPLDQEKYEGDTEPLKRMEKFTIITQVMLEKSKQQECTIFGFSQCGGWALVIDHNDELIFRQRCKDNDFKSGFYFPILKKIKIAITYNSRAIKIYIDSVIQNNQVKKYDFSSQGQFDIGYYSTTNNQVIRNFQKTFNQFINRFFISLKFVWYGQIDYILIYAEHMSVHMIKEMYEEGEKISDNLQSDQGQMFTIDKRLCISSVTNNTIPALDETILAPKKPHDYEGLEPDDPLVISQNREEQEKGEGQTIDIQCNQSPKDLKLTYLSGKHYRVFCPGNCLEAARSYVFGTQVYAQESSICKSAIHANIINNQGGVFIITIAQGQDAFHESFQNGIQSINFGRSERSFYMRRSQEVKKIDCETICQGLDFAGPILQNFTVLCPANCSKLVLPLYGNNIYSDDSSICIAAIQQNLLTDKGGEVTFVLQKGQQNYQSTFKNGIWSQNKESYIRSFEFLGSSANTCQYFDEDFQNPDMFARWDIIDIDRRDWVHSAWALTKCPTLFTNKKSCIYQNSTIARSMLFHKMVDCTDAEFKVNIFFEELKNAAIMFRVQSEKDYYSLEMNNQDGSLGFYKMTDRVLEFMKDIDYAFQVKKWYRFKISFENSKIKIYVQEEKKRKIHLLAEIEDDEYESGKNARGSVGIAVSDNQKTFFEGLKLTEVVHPEGIPDFQKSDSVKWSSCITKDGNYRQKICNNHYKGFLYGRQRCLSEDYYFCYTCCQEVVNIMDNILNYSCQKQCKKFLKDDVKDDD